MIKKFVVIMLLSLPVGVFAAAEDDPLLYKVMINQFELRAGDRADPFVLDADAWMGFDLNKIWLKVEMEKVSGDIEEAEAQLLYSRAIAPFWDLQAGWRHDIKPNPDRDYFVLGFKGLAPYQFEVDASVFIGESGQMALRLDAEYEYMFSQKLILSPEIEINLHSKDDIAVGVGSGLSDMDLGLRLRYEIRREFSPYIGVNWSKKFGQTADLATADGEDDSDVRFIIGIRMWF